LDILVVLIGLKLELIIYVKEKHAGILETKWQGNLGLERGLIRAQKLYNKSKISPDSVRSIIFRTIHVGNGTRTKGNACYGNFMS
jgi:hypothetical protein